MKSELIFDLIKSYGLPTLLAVLLAFLLVRQMDMLSDQVEFIARLVDTMCSGSR